MKTDGLKQRTEKRLMFATHRKIVREELNRTIAEIDEMEGLEIDFDLISKKAVLKALDSEEKNK